MKKILYSLAILSIVSSCGSLKKTKNNSQKVEKSSPSAEYLVQFHEGLRYKMRGQYQEAIKAFEYCIAKNPTDDAAHYALSEIYLETNQLPKAEASILKASKIDPSNDWYAEELGYMYYQKNNFSEAAKIFKTLTQKNERNIDWQYIYAETLLKNNDISGAIKALDKLEGLTGKNVEITLEKFKMYRSIKQDDKAEQELIKSLEYFKNEPKILANLIDYYFEKNKNEKAYEMLKNLADTDPTNGIANIALSEYYFKENNTTKAFYYLNAGLSSDNVTMDQKIAFLLDLYERKTPVGSEIITSLDTLIAKYPTDAKGYTLKADFLLQKEKNKEALFAFKQALKYDQSKYPIWDKVLMLEYQQQDFESLYHSSKQCLELFPNMLNVYYFNAIASNQTKRYNDAINTLDAGYELIGDTKLKADFEAQYGEAYFGLKNFKLAQEHYDKALKLDPSNFLYANNYAYRLALNKIDLSKAETLAKSVLTEHQNEAKFIDTYGFVLFNQGKFAEALIQFEKALKINEKDALINEHVGDANSKLGKTTEALKFWKIAKSLGATNKSLDKKIDKTEYHEPVY